MLWNSCSFAAGKACFRFIGCKKRFMVCAGFSIEKIWMQNCGRLLWALLRHLENDSFNEEELCELCIQVGDALVAKFGFEPFMQVFSKNYALFSCFCANEKGIWTCNFMCNWRKELFKTWILYWKEKKRALNLTLFLVHTNHLWKTCLCIEIQEHQEQIVPLLQAFPFQFRFMSFQMKNSRAFYSGFPKCFPHSKKN